LTQVLEDDEHTYLYGVRRIAQHSATGTDYFGFASQSLTDALGSVRQLADADGQVSLAQSYKPYGETLSSSVTETTTTIYIGNFFEWVVSEAPTATMKTYDYAGATRVARRGDWQSTSPVTPM
jgi:hypothetical protein